LIIISNAKYVNVSDHISIIMDLASKILLKSQKCTLHNNRTDWIMFVVDLLNLLKLSLDKNKNEIKNRKRYNLCGQTFQYIGTIYCKISCKGKKNAGCIDDMAHNSRNLQGLVLIRRDKAPSW